MRTVIVGVILGVVSAVAVIVADLLLLRFGFRFRRYLGRDD